jgi:AcrR family transcriptional regulator
MAKKRFGTDIRHDQIAEAALEIVRAQGVRALNVVAVAERVGVVPSALYRHFKNKSAIVAAVMHLIRTRLNKHFQDVVDLEMAPLEKLQLLFTRHIEMIGGNNAIPRLIFSEEVLAGVEDQRRQLYGIIQDVINNVATIVREGQKNGALRDDLAPESIAVSFLGMIQPAAIIWSLSEGEFDLAQHGRQAWQLFSNAVQPDRHEKIG